MGPARSFPTLKSESINLVQMVIWVEKNWAGPFFPRPRLVKTSTIPCHEYANNLGFLGGGEKLGPPILSPTPTW